MMSDDNIELEAVEIVQDNARKLPCVLLLDVSGSMGGSPIKQLNLGLETFADELQSDPQARNTVEVSIVTFGSGVNVLQDFIAARDFRPPTLSVSGLTPMGEAIRKGCNMISERKRHYRANGISYYRPWVFMITDGSPTDEWGDAATMVSEMEENKKGSFWALGVEDADLDTLKEISHRPPIALEGLQFRELFQWLSASLSSVSQSSPGEQLQLPAPPDAFSVVS